MYGDLVAEYALTYVHDTTHAGTSAHVCRPLGIHACEHIVCLHAPRSLAHVHARTPEKKSTGLPRHPHAHLLLKSEM